jgi:hypothetical protein
MIHPVNKYLPVTSLRLWKIEIPVNSNFFTDSLCLLFLCISKKVKIQRDFHFLLTFLICIFFLFTDHATAATFDSDLQTELITMCEKDQELRMQWIHAKDATDKDEWDKRIIEIDELHLIRLIEIVENQGWPGESIVGPVGSQAFWLLVQHTPDHHFQSRCLELLEIALLNREASPIHLAYLKDRVYIHAGKKQIYGTQVKEDLTLYPIEDEEHVNERRIAIGLSTVEEYLEEIKKLYQIAAP